MKKVSRRQFANFILNIAFLNSFPFLKGLNLAKAQSQPKKSKVVRVTDGKATAAATGKDDADLNESTVREMVEHGIKTLTRESTVEEAWSRIIPDPTKKVAIKINCQVTSIFTKSKVVSAVTDGLIRRGVSPSNIIIYDLRDNAFAYAGFKKNLGHGVKVGTIAELGGYSWLSWFGNPLWDVREKFCKVLAGEGRYGCDYLINVPVLKALDGWAGVSMSMKNHFGSISNPAGLHPTMHDSIAALNAHRLISRKTRLILLDGIFAGIKWINGRNQDYVVKNNQLLFGLDPVAIDYLGWQAIESYRKNHGLKPLEPTPEYLHIASANYGLGNDDPQHIDLTDI